MKVLNILKQWHNNRDYLRLSIFALIIIVLLELTVFNYKFYSNMANEPIEVQLNTYGAISKTTDSYYKTGENECGFEIRNINTHIKNIFVDMEVSGIKNTPSTKKIDITISATDAGNSNYFDLPTKTVVYNQSRTKYINLNLNGDTEKLRIKLNDCKNKTINVNNVVLNSKVPFTFDIIRVVTLFAIAAIVYIIRPKSQFYAFVFNEKSLKQKLALGVVIVLNSAVIMGLGIFHPNNGINAASHHHQYNLLAEAILEGHFYLSDEPTEALVNMENPYDRRERDKVMAETGERYKWDTAYYNGKYYVYFGIVPVLLFFLPFRMLRLVIINKAPVIVMLILAVIFGYLLMRELTRRWFKDTSFLVYMLMSVLFVNSMGIYLGIRVPDLYMIPISHALAFSLIGLYMWLRALPDSEGESLDGVRLCIGSVFMALVAGCRPQVVLASFLAVPLLWKYVFKERQLFSLKSIGRTLGFVLPYVVVAAFLMYYNYARFGNVFDFGASYNLTVMDMVSEKFSIGKIPLGLYSYYLQPPVLNGVFPYIEKAVIEKNFMGNYVMEQLYGGMLPCNIILLSLLYIGKVKYQLKEKNIYIFSLLMLGIGVIITVADFNIGGLIHRYMVDFMWLIFIPAIIVVLALYEKYKDTDFKGIIKTFISVGFVWSMAYNFILLFNTGTASYKDNIPELFNYVKHMIEFWV